MHLLVEELRPRGTGEALEAAGLLEKDKTEFISTLEKLIIGTAARKLPPAAAKSVLTCEDLELIYELLIAVHHSDSYLKWGDRREFV